MKKIVFILIFLQSFLYAEYVEGGLYFGAGAGSYYENFTTDEKIESSSAIANLKIGYGVRKAYAIELSIDYTPNKSTIFSSSGEDGDKFGFNVDLVKAFDYNIYILPFIKAGFGSGTMKIQRTLQKSLTYGSYNLTGGCFIPIDKTFDIELGYQYRYVTYSAINTIAQRIKYKSHVSILYSGINIRF